jgi:hypothetical protein
VSKYKDYFLMALSVFICIAIVANAIKTKDNGMVRDLMAVLAFWMPSPISGIVNKNTEGGN